MFSITVLNSVGFSFIFLPSFPKHFSVRMNKEAANGCSMEEVKIHSVIEDDLGPFQ